MIAVNFKYQIGTNKFSDEKKIKTDWKELTFAELLKLLDNASIEDENSRIATNLVVISDLSEEDIRHLDEDHIAAIRPWISFVDQVERLKVSEIPEFISKINIGAESWGKYEAAIQLIGAGNEKSLMPAIAQIVSIYADIDILPYKVPDAYPIALYFINQLKEFQLKYSRLQDYKPKQKDIAAGVEKLNQYGFFTTLHALAKGDPLKYDDMLLQPADNVYQTLVLDFELSEIRKKYQENEDAERKRK